MRDHITNINILERMNKGLEIVKTIKSRKLQYLGHVMRHPEKYSLLQLKIQGKIVGKRSRGRPQIFWFDNLRKWFNTSTIVLHTIVEQPLTTSKLLTCLPTFVNEYGTRKRRFVISFKILIIIVRYFYIIILVILFHIPETITRDPVI
jgi:hypothetical protein